MKILLTILLLPVFVAVFCYFSWQPEMDGEIRLQGLNQTVKISFDGFANPVIKAENKQDAFFALGFITAQERLFQMDLLRRKSAGRLSELFGIPALEADKQSRVLGLQQLALNIVKSLPDSQQQVLKAYSAGVNAYIEDMTLPPVECVMLGYIPQKWQPEDSLLVGLNIFRTLNRNEAEERMLSVMYAALPKSVVDFLTPDQDIYTNQAALSKQGGTQEIEFNIPDAVLNFNRSANSNQHPQSIDTSPLPIGSNQWVFQSADKGQAILANDMHLPLSVPDIWYQAQLNYQGRLLKGITLPGLPLLVAGSNGNVSWSFTNTEADVLDLITLTIDSKNPELYRSAEGWKSFVFREETIKIKNEPDYVFRVKETDWGPVLAQPLLGKQVAIQWTLFEPDAVNLNLLDIDHVKEIDAAIDLFHHAGLPALNVVLADKQGAIAWTLTGKLPDRSASLDVKDLKKTAIGRGWNSLLAPDKYPVIKNPVSGYLVTANNRVLNASNDLQYGLNFANSYRAFRITELLHSAADPEIADFYHMQLDTRSEFYDFYRQLALSVINDQALTEYSQLQPIQTALKNWHGHAEVDSIGLGLIIEFRKQLLRWVFADYLASCNKVDMDFKYSWFDNDTPLRTLLTRQVPNTLPVSGNYKSWQDLILKALVAAGETIQAKYPNSDLASIRWGDRDPMQIRHPFSQAMPWFGQFLDMPKRPLAGCPACVRVLSNGFGASMRMVVKPGNEDTMLLLLTTGQSGNPFSSHYRDQYQYWVEGTIPDSKLFEAQHQLLLTPD